MPKPFDNVEAREAFASLPDHWHTAIAEYTTHRLGCPAEDGDGDCECAVHQFRDSIMVALHRHLSGGSQAQPERAVAKVDGAWDEGDATRLEVTALIEPASEWREIVESGGRLYAHPPRGSQAQEGERVEGLYEEVAREAHDIGWANAKGSSDIHESRRAALICAKTTVSLAEPGLHPIQTDGGEAPHE